MKLLRNKKTIMFIITLLIIFVLLFIPTGCNKQIFDTKYTFHEAICNYDGIEFKLKIKKWKDYEGEQLQIIDKNGDTYLISANKCYLKG